MIAAALIIGSAIVIAGILILVGLLHIAYALLGVVAELAENDPNDHVRTD